MHYPIAHVRIVAFVSRLLPLEVVALFRRNCSNDDGQMKLPGFDIGSAGEGAA
jgi:hypothetical protein